MIPYKSIKISQLNEFGKNTLSDHLQMKVTDLGEDYVTMSMPVSSQVHQPMGLLHGGAVAALAENVHPAIKYSSSNTISKIVSVFV